MRRILFYLGPLPIKTFGVMIALGALAAILVILREARRKGLNEDRVLDFTLWALILGIVGARIGYILFANPISYIRNPMLFFHFQDGGLSIHGALIGGMLAGVIFSRLYRLPFWRLADVVAPGLALGIAIGRVGCDVFGRPMATPWPWGVMVNGQLLHPAQVYEFLLDYLLFFYLWRRRKNVAYDGQLFIRFAILYATIRGVVELVRYNPLIWGPFSVAHAASLTFIFAAVLAGIILKKRPGQQANSGAPVAATAPRPGDMLAAIEDRLAWQLLILAVLVSLSLVTFYSLGP
ncbi:Prolipoprotein diacylglyceryl transferase [Moorella thermoacetica]|uniref:Phosphatidylglycerol--prolipoprotein diacylglyceryl transferase n=1 Tax=Neomoorella thermoacetica TaxID=1525 RepID=A0AAC9MVQ7_NEOTH|nr:prolipoprotein diacylglyceryl transferase [Moorella thermoacetica]AOQ24959.1 Prolipoprotein diacylglyceryl transferase [Moorella thermoacetica]TYL15499.1 Prolipoprotein diacylglyceryl transferase [Moorella thermoacetica]